MKKLFYIFFILFCFKLSYSQNGFVLDQERPSKIYFKLINNLIVIPVEVNNVKLSFLLDTGVSRPILFNILNFNEKLEVNNKESIFLRGLGDGDTVEAIKSTNNVFKIGNTINLNQDLYAINNPEIDFMARLGLPIHGIIGYDFLNNFIVEINYSKKYLKVHNPKFYKKKKCKKCLESDMVFHNNKPFINVQAVLSNNNLIDLKLLIDSGGSDALWLFENKDNNINIPLNNFDDFLGRGLSGNVYGKRAKINQLNIGEFKLTNVNTAFPDSLSIGFASRNTSRNGSLSGDVLKRFNIIFDYPNKKISFKKNRHFNDPFKYNKSGISIEHQGARLVKKVTKNFNFKTYDSENQNSTFSTIESYKYIFVPAYKIVQIRKDSPADKAGLLINDIVISVNRKPTHTLGLQDIIDIFYGDEGKTVRMIVERNGIQLRYSFVLKSML